jgi:hypothetical protein
MVKELPPGPDKVGEAKTIDAVAIGHEPIGKATNVSKPGLELECCIGAPTEAK